MINDWNELDDELDELKKIFFEFLKRWTDTERNEELDPNRPDYYQVLHDAEEFKLDETMDEPSIEEEEKQATTQEYGKL